MFHFISDIDDACCNLLNMFQNQLETVLKIFRYSMQTPVYEESLTELTEIYGNFSFLGYPNVSNLDPFERNLMLSNPDARVFFCMYDGKPEAWKPQNCNLFFRSITNEGFGYSFNKANFWDMFTNTTYNRNFSAIMRPKGHDQLPSPPSKDMESRIYPSKGIMFPKVIQTVFFGFFI